MSFVKVKPPSIDLFITLWLPYASSAPTIITIFPLFEQATAVG